MCFISVCVSMWVRVCVCACNGTIWESYLWFYVFVCINLCVFVMVRTGKTIFDTRRSGMCSYVCVCQWICVYVLVMVRTNKSFYTPDKKVCVFMCVYLCEFLFVFLIRCTAKSFYKLKKTHQIFACIYICIRVNGCMFVMILAMKSK